MFQSVKRLSELKIPRVLSLLRFDRPIHHNFQRRSRMQHDVLAPGQQDDCGADSGAGRAADSCAFKATVSESADNPAIRGCPGDGTGIRTFGSLAFNRCFSLTRAGFADAAEGGIEGQGVAVGEDDLLERDRQLGFPFDASRT